MKKGEMTSKQIVTLILLVVSLAIIFLIWNQIGFEGKIDDETCHQSVIYRATISEVSPSGVGSASEELIPLKCKTQKICLSNNLIGKGECEEYQNSGGFTTAKVKSSDDASKIVADEIVDCWRMMGEGKVSLFSSFLAKEFGVGQIYPSCIICSRIAFEKDLDKSILEKMNVLDYTQKHNIPGEEKSYYDYLLGNSPAKFSITNQLNVQEISQDSNGNIITNPISVPLSSPNSVGQDPSKELAIVFMQISTPDYWGVAKNDLRLVVGGLVAGTVVAGPTAVFNTIKLAFKGGYVTLAAIAIAGVYQAGSVAYNQAVSTTYCGDVEMGDSKSGCSVVRTMYYDASEIKKYCGVIESIS